MGCSASTQNPSVIASSDERLVGQPHHRAKRDPLADKHLAGDSPGGREAPFSCSEPLPTPKVSRDGRLQFACLSPALLILDDLLSSEECDGLVALASGGAFARRARQRTVLASRLTCHPLLSPAWFSPGPDLRRSRVTDGHVSSGRTSHSTFLTGVKVRSGTRGQQLQMRCTRKSSTTCTDFSILAGKSPIGHPHRGTRDSGRQRSANAAGRHRWRTERFAGGLVRRSRASSGRAIHGVARLCTTLRQ